MFKLNQYVIQNLRIINGDFNYTLYSLDVFKSLLFENFEKKSIKKKVLKKKVLLKVILIMNIIC